MPFCDEKPAGQPFIRNTRRAWNTTGQPSRKSRPISPFYNWRNQARLRGPAGPGPKPNNTDQWSAEAKLATVIETASLSEAQLNEYCREKGLFGEQVKSWKAASLAGFQTSDVQDKVIKQQSKADRLQIKKLEMAASSL